MNGEYTLSTIPKPKRDSRTDRKTNGSQIDWDTVRQTVLKTSAKLAWMDDMPQEALDEIWAKRAAQVAQLIEDGETGEQIEVVTVRLGQEVYGMEADYVFDIRKLESLTRVPRVPDWIAGVTNLRGRIISVVDLHRFLGLPSAEKEDGAESTARYMVVVETQSMELGLLVDEVKTVETLPRTLIQEASSVVRGIQIEYMQGIVVPTRAGADTSPRLILDLPALLADKRLIVHEDII
jgi:purine-binding chemotaxis protein CheW